MATTSGPLLWRTQRAGERGRARTKEEGADRDTHGVPSIPSNAQNRDIQSRREQIKHFGPDQLLGGTGTRATQRIDWPKEGWTRRSIARSAGTTSRS